MMYERYVHIPVYTLNLRLYPTPVQKETIDTILNEIQKTYNMAVYDMFTNFANTKEQPDKEHEGKTIHFPDINSIIKKDYLDKLREERPLLTMVPASALSGKSGIFQRDFSKRLDAQVSNQNQRKKTNGKGVKRPIENSKPPYYSRKNPVRSYSYQETLSKILLSETNENVVFFNLAKVGRIKARGMRDYLRILRFDPTCSMTFQDYITLNKRKKMLFTVKKDNCGDYFLQICLKDVYKLIKDSEGKKEIGIDVGVSTLMTLSDGTKYDNPRFKNGKHGEVHKHREQINRQLARRQGFVNIEFRKRYKAENLFPSKRYEKTKSKKAKLERKISRQRKHHMENMVLDVVRNSSFIGIENLSVKSMFSTKNKRKNDNLSDAAMGEILSLLSRKGKEYNIPVVEIGRYEKSTQTCSTCGYVNKEVKNTSIRSWVCPCCQSKHDRDINAAKNILNMAKKKIA